MTLARPGIASRRCSTDSLGEAIPATEWRCAMRPVSAPRHCAAYPVRLTRRALEGRPAAPSNAFSLTMQGHAVTSGRRERSFPSLSTLCGHPRHYRTTPGTVTTSRCCWSARGQDVATTATVPRTGPR
jgi:hypothetical protein